MKKRYKHLENSKGFYFVYVNVVIVIILAVVTTSILFYENELRISRMLIEQTKLETLIQLGRGKFQTDEPYTTSKEGVAVYNFPDGRVRLDYTNMKDDQWNIKYTITMKEGQEYILYEYYVSSKKCCN